MDQILAEEEVDGGTPDLVAWTLADHLNTVRDIAKYDPQTDTTTVVNHLVYDAFGNITSESNPAVDSLFLFTARPFDLDTGLQNNLNRWYDPRVGRWLSEDPMGFAAGINLCEYVGNAPVYHTDPYGLKPLGQKWDVPDFFWWYYFGFGQEVSLHKIGLLQPWWQEIKPQVQVQLRHRLVPKLISQLSCESGITKAQVNLSDLVPVVLDVHSGGGMFDVLTIMRHSNVRVRGTCEVTIDCKGCNEDLWISASSGTCDLWFHVRDRFQNPLDIGGQFAPIDLPFAKPYDLVATWYWKFTWKETYPCPKK
ncbi:RHS repeat domain-containing protein [Thermopirellula anaerolimosa]